MTSSSTTPAGKPETSGYFMPAEWHPHEGCLMAWPCRPETWPEDGGLEAACDAYTAVAQAIAEFEPVTMVCRPEDVADASLACGRGIALMPLPLSDSWLRDTGPSYLINGKGGRKGVCWGFNAWGGNYDDCTADQGVATAILGMQGIADVAAPLIMEGGSFHIDGEGTLITTEQCLLNANRNPGMTRHEIETALKAYLGVRQVIWLGEGYQDDETDGHIDEILTYLRPGVVMVTSTDDPSDGNFKAFQDNLDRLKKARDARGRELEVVQVPQPERRDRNGIRLTLSYTNLYLANGGVVMPSFTDAGDDEAYRILRKAFPDRLVVKVPAADIVAGGGGIHCITQQIPQP